jgi:hypothetical protein
MQQKFNSMRISFILGGGCFVVMMFLLAIAYIPDFLPRAYENFRRTGLITIVPTMAAIGFISSIGWLWWECRAASSPDEDQEH